MKIDTYKHKARYENWKARVKKEGIKELSKKNSDILLRYIFDMEKGININGSKGCRSPARLNNLRQRLVFLFKEFEERFNVLDITTIKEQDIFNFFSDMRKGKILTQKKKKYKSIGDYVKVFKAFYHWYMKVSKKKGKEVKDITFDLDTSTEKPKWVYLKEEQINVLFNRAKYEYQVLIMFLFDSGIRSPTELINVKVSDLSSDCKVLNIREEISKTFGRRIKLMLSYGLLKEYIEKKGLKENDYLFPICPKVTNQYLKRLGKKCFGEKESLAGEKYSNLTLYDFRHCSCCYWLPRYKSESALKYRFGWKKSDKIHYYSELLGMKDTISEEDLLLDITKTEIERRLIKTEKENELLQYRLQRMENQLKEICVLNERLLENKKFKGFIEECKTAYTTSQK